jgi:putative ABC transport system substrate-binding protein
MRRREFISLFCGIAAIASGSARAQSSGSLHRIGFLGNSTAILEANLIGPFRKALRDLGYAEGRDIAIEYRWAEGNYERIPCVMVAVGDPVGTGLVVSLARPGGNLTGLTSISPELEGKRLALLREMVPTLSHFAVLWNPANAFHVAAERGVQAAAKDFRMKVLSLGVRTSGELDDAFSAILAERPGALIVLADRVFLHGRDRIMAFAGQQRLPGVYAYRELVEAGGLMS